MSWVLLILAILAVIIFLVIYFYPTLLYAPVNIGFSGPVDLSTVTMLFDATTVNSFEKNNYGTLQGFVNIIPLQRTPTAMTCGTANNPSCDTGRFDTCSCTDTSCSNCQRSGYYPLLKIGSTVSLEILPAPDAGRQGQVMAQLAITTQTITMPGSSNATASYVEILNLPPIPSQKWVMITIVKEGRRFSIYYDNALVLSQKTSYYIAPSTINNGIICGNPIFNGSGSTFNLTQTAMSGMEIAAAHTRLSDTRGVPYISSIKNNLDLTLPSLCPAGGCIQTPTIRPAQPYLEWNTSYA